ncbi:hypothetical protein [Gracilimonas amylolytica]|uniref:hypothetical protein n=1 Tax=Gracilimonas amylolytica TaxID=1749045 RepID=UPI0012FFF257|nr:hypothetical protein [Gracilimonas amylolytica]
MEKVYPENTNYSHKTDLKEAIYYLPLEFGHQTLYKSLRAVYGEEDGKDLAVEWFAKAKIALPSTFDNDWEEAILPPYQKQNLDDYLSKHLYAVARESGWAPKAFRKGKNTKKPPRKRNIKEVGVRLKSSEKLEEGLTKAKESGLPESNRSYISPHITNMDGACYFHPYMKKHDVPEQRDDYLDLLEKIVDCEVIVEEAIEILLERPGQQVEDKEVRYKLRLTNRKDKDVITVASFEELTTMAHFSSFLVSKGFVKFIGNSERFDQFHSFLINEQEYQTVKKLTSWGEYKPGQFLFENGLFDVNRGLYYPADEQNRIEKGHHMLSCPTGSDLIRPPRLSVPEDMEESARFLAEKFNLWESFNGRLNVRVTLGYAVACLFSRHIVEKEGGFPLLFKFGERGTGKSSSMDWFMSLFGYQSGNRQSVSKQNTIKGLIRNMTLPTCFPFFLDDYRNHETNNQVPDLTSPILNWYHRIGTSMAKKSTDNQTIDTRMKASVVMTGNDKPFDPAVLSRLIILNYKKFLTGGDLEKVPEVAQHTHRFSEFTYLILSSYDEMKGHYMDFLEGNKKALADKGFQGRTVNNWAYVMAGIQCVPYILGDLGHWQDEFEALKSEIHEAIRKEIVHQKEHNPLHEFFQALEYYATQKIDSGSEYNRRFKVLDHRHFRYKAFKEFETGGSIYKGEVLYLNLPGLWPVLRDLNAEVTKQTTLPSITDRLEQSSYFLARSEQILLTKDIDEPGKESNRRSLVLNVRQLKEKEVLEELIEKAKEYELQRPARLGG